LVKIKKFLSLFLFFSYLTLILSDKSKAGYIYDPQYEVRSNNYINMPQCYFYFYDDHPEKHSKLTGAIIFPLKIALLPLSALDGEEWGAMDHIKTHFRSDTNYPGKDKILILKNLSFGKDINNNASVYSIRKYDTNQGSESINIARGKTHSNKFFIVKAGNNSINYEIINNQNNLLLEKGNFNLYVNAYRYKGCGDDGKMWRKYGNY